MRFTIPPMKYALATGVAIAVLSEFEPGIFSVAVVAVLLARTLGSTVPLLYQKKVAHATISHGDDTTSTTCSNGKFMMTRTTLETSLREMRLVLKMDLCRRMLTGWRCADG